MILGTKGRYAVMAMVELAMRQKGICKPVTLAEIAECQEIPLSYLEQIFSLLRKNGLVRSVRGPGGGYVLEREASDTRISDVIMAVEEQIRMTRCESGAKGCMASHARCVTHDLWEGLEQQIYQYLRGLTLGDVCGKKVFSKMAEIPVMEFIPRECAGERVAI